MIIRQPPKLTNQQSIIKYVVVDLWSWLRELATSTLKISFDDNFQSFVVKDLIIKANTEHAIPNEFRRSSSGDIPRYRIIVRQTGNATIIDGDTKWSETHVYLKNVSANDATITVIFFK